MDCTGWTSSVLIRLRFDVVDRRSILLWWTDAKRITSVKYEEEDELSLTDECVTIRRYKISWLLFVGDLVLLVPSKSGFQHRLNGVAAACDITEVKICSSKSFDESCSMFLASWRKIIEEGGKV